MENINIYPKGSITASYSRKVNLGNYESEDFFMSVNHSWFDREPTHEEVTAKYEELYALCKAMVELRIKDGTAKSTATTINKGGLPF